MELYAQWGNGHSYYVRYACKYNQCQSGSAQYSSGSSKDYGTKFRLDNNTCLVLPHLVQIVSANNPSSFLNQLVIFLILYTLPTILSNSSSE